MSTKPPEGCAVSLFSHQQSCRLRRRDEGSLRRARAAQPVQRVKAVLEGDAIIPPAFTRPSFQVFDGVPDGGNDQTAGWRMDSDGGGKAFFTQDSDSLIPAAKPGFNARDKISFHRNLRSC